MGGSELASRITDVLELDAEAFDAQVRSEVDWLKAAVRDGTFDNPQAIVGLEYETYGVDADTGALKRVPRRLLELIGLEKELGLHNAELHTSPQPFNQYGLASQQTEIQARFDAALSQTGFERTRLVSDGIWTIPPTGTTAREYLTDSIEEDGIRVATNMSDAVRYHAMANTEYTPAMRLCSPHVSLEAQTVMPESLITSIQPHYQMLHAPYLPNYFAYALRIAGPLLALGVNSPFFPPDLYDDVDPEDILADQWMEHRISVFESILNPRDDGTGADGSGAPPSAKVSFPRDLTTVEEAIDRIADDEIVVPMEVESGKRFDDEFVHFRHKHGSYWRWVRPVFGGATRSSANARIEFRPLSAQPTIRDSIAFLAAFAGLMQSLPHREHPLGELDWERARENFYAAMRDGLEADFVWITADGEQTHQTDVIYGELLKYARDGLRRQNVPSNEIDHYLEPLRQRVDRGTTPGSWKHEEVRRRIDDGASLEEAIYGMQREYIRYQAETLITETFADWLDDR